VVRTRRAKTRGGILLELTAAVGILAIVLAGFAAACHTDQRMLRASYIRAVAIEIVDGEMETLVAGEWRAYPDGTHQLTPRADAARNLPDGTLRLTRRGARLRLEWLPARRGYGGRVVREATVR